MTHIYESEFGKSVVEWFESYYGEDAVETQVYQSEPRWFCDIVVDVTFGTLYIEVESRASEVRPGVSQTLGYAADDIERGVPMVVTPKGHVDEERLRRLRMNSTVLIREFDEDSEEWV